MFREVVGSRFQALMYWFLQIQAWVAAFLALSIFVAAHNPVPGLRWLDFLAASLFTIGIVGEGLADCALNRFKSDPENKGLVLDRGLWAWTRHPNYFFEWLVWLAYPLFAIDLTGGYPWGWLALSAPAAMYLVLRHMTGVPALEAAMTSTKGDAYRAYQGRVSAFFPRPPRRAS
jgi:steroid 5-alpha reductase family enzyme